MKRKLSVFLSIICSCIFLSGSSLYAKEPGRNLRDDGELFKVAIAGYTFVNFNLDETLKMM